MVELPHQKAITLSEEDYDVSVSADLLENPVDAQLRQWGLTGHADIAISLAKKCFGADIKFEKSILEREEDEVLLIEVHTSGEAEVVRRQYHRYVALVVEQIPWPEIGRISLIYYRE